MQKTIIITGATSGIGFECVKQFLELGNYTVIALGRNLDKLKPFNNEKFI